TTGEQKFIYLYINTKAAKYPNTEKNTPLNLSLVLDRSGSMSGAKLKYAREASKIVIDHLDENDKVSIVAYDHEIEVMQPSMSIANNKTRKQLKRKIDAIYDNGSTNLGGGMLEGFQQVSDYYDAHYVNRVLLLSDGLANKGIIDPDILKDTSEYFNQRKNMSLSTFGLGADFDEDLMEGLSEYGGGNYYFIDKAIKVTEILLSELQILQHIVTQKEQLKVRFPSEILKLEKVYGLPVHEEEGLITLPFSNMFAEEQKTALLKFSVLKNFSTPLDIETVFSYRGIVDQYLNEDIVQWKKTLQIRPTLSETEWKNHHNEEVHQQIALFESNAVFRKAIEAIDSGQTNVARSLLKKNIIYLNQQLKGFAGNAFLTKLKEYNQTYLSHLEEFEQYDKHEKKILQKTTKNEYYRLLKKKDRANSN
ncbi:MAG: vWA domain-containing protein, partial [Chitinophagales bacterium]